MTGNAIESREQTRRYPGTGRPGLGALDGVCLAGGPGEVHGLLGSEDASATTLYRISAMVLWPSADCGRGLPRGGRMAGGVGWGACSAFDLTVRDAR